MCCKSNSPALAQIHNVESRQKDSHCKFTFCKTIDCFGQCPRNDCEGFVIAINTQCFVAIYNTESCL
ncbi:hypothetical protein [Helicobacter sp.]|uniref:hypothetical protein n=1 Tax=Helicobacter sp. TaxID=218 RepID=UPI0025BCBC09|nr:hypothetical protein [Helicobacter sp.]